MNPFTFDSNPRSAPLESMDYAPENLPSDQPYGKLDTIDGIFDLKRLIRFAARRCYIVGGGVIGMSLIAVFAAAMMGSIQDTGSLIKKPAEDPWRFPMGMKAGWLFEPRTRAPYVLSRCMVIDFALYL